MQALSDRFVAALNGPHTVVARVDLIRGRAITARIESALSGEPVDQAILDGRGILDGRISIKRTGGARRSGSITLLDPPPVTAYGDLIKCWRGIRFDDDTVEWCAIGTLWVTSVQTSYQGRRRVVQVDGVDLSTVVAKRRWPRPYTISAGTPFTAAIADIIDDRLPGTEKRIVASPLRVEVPTFYDGANDDPWQAVTKLAAACNREAWFDPHGTFMLTPPPSRSDGVVHTIADGRFNGTIISTARRESSDPGPNAVIVVGTNPAAGADIWGEAWDDDPASPTWRFGPYGQQPQYVGSSLVHTYSQARELAASEMAKLTLSTVTFDATCAPHPGLEAGDRVRIVRRADGLDETVTVDTIDLPLGAGEMRVGSEQAVQALARTIRTFGQGSNPVTRIARRYRANSGGGDGGGDTNSGSVTGTDVDLPAAPVPSSAPIPPDPAAAPAAPDPAPAPVNPADIPPYSIPMAAIEAPAILPPDNELTGIIAGALFDKDIYGNTSVTSDQTNIVLWAKGSASPDNDATLWLIANPTDIGDMPAEAHLAASGTGVHVNKANDTYYTVAGQGAVIFKVLDQYAGQIYASDQDNLAFDFDLRDWTSSTLVVKTSDYVQIKSGKSAELSADDDRNVTLKSYGTNGDGTIVVGNSDNKLSFFSSGGATKQDVSGSTTASLLSSLIDALNAYGLFNDLR